MLQKPVLALRRNRKILAAENPVCGNPENWFTDASFLDRDIHAASFDFFVNWENHTICDEIWIKRISTSDDIFTKSKTELRDEIAKTDGYEKSKYFYYFCQANNLIEKYMLFRDVPEEEWAKGTEKIVEFNLSSYDDQSVKLISAEEIQEKIKQFRKKPASIGNAGLIYSTSSLEGYLSHQPYFWPGDADTILFDANYKVMAVLEFKKHTARSAIPFEHQRLSNYLSRDILKYESLALLRDRFQTDLYIIYYPIPKQMNYILIEKAVGPYHALSSGGIERLEMPNPADRNSMNHFADRFVKMITGAF